MTAQYAPKWLDSLNVNDPVSVSFIEFCRLELHRRHSKEEEFNEEVYEEATRLVLETLGTLEMEKL